MTRFLSESLEAEEPYFRLGLQKLETSNGNPSTDIRFTNEVMQTTKTKYVELGLDPNDTTPAELYEALREKLRQDDKLLTKQLRTLAATYDSAEADPVAGMVRVLNKLSDSKRCYALKPARLKTLLKAQPPKKAMKRLNYRSLDSMLKHEVPALVLTAALLSESESWHKHLLDQYKKLKVSDFEDKNINILHPTSSKWRELASEIEGEARNFLISFKELGAVVLLPLPKVVPDGTITACLSLVLGELNEIRACSTFLKLNRGQPDFGHSVVDVVSSQPVLKSELLDKPVPWNLIQHYYSRLNKRFKEDVFEPYVRLEDMVWHPIEKTLAEIEPSFAFWKNSSCLGLIDNGKPLSLNLVDSALNLCNLRPYENRLSHYFQHSLWHELLLRYLKHEPVEQSVLANLQPELAEERALA